jgi:putative inorganic carbon (hco3(-)) transporter
MRVEVVSDVTGLQGTGGPLLDRHILRRSSLHRVSWSMAYIGLLGYTLAIVTYVVPIGNLAMAVALLGVLLNPRLIRIPPFLILLALFIIWSAIGYTVSPYRDAVRESLDAAVRLWLIAFVAVNAIRTPAQLRLYLIFFLGCFAMYPARGAIFNYIGGYTVWGRALWNQAFGNPNDLAALSFLPLAIAVGLVVTERNRLFRFGALASLVVLPVLILLTQSRGAFIALVIIGLFVLAGKRRKARLLMGAAGLALITLLTVPESAWERFSGIASLTRVEAVGDADPEGSAEERFNIWRVAGLIIQDNKLMGVGLGTYPYAHDRYATAIPEASQGFRDAHSTYLSVLATTGVPGLLLFLGVLGAALGHAELTRRRIKREAPSYAMLVGSLQLGLIAYLITGIFGSFSLLALLYLHLALLSAAGTVARTEQRLARKAGAPHGLTFAQAPR